MTTNAQKLAQFFSNDRPLGSDEAVHHLSETDQSVFRSYFHELNQPISQIRSQSPTMIVGRRGSGKTDALLWHSFMPQPIGHFSPVVYFDADNSALLFQNILTLINQQIRRDVPKPMVEMVSTLWSYIFWVTIIFEIYKSEEISYKDGIIDRFIVGLGLSKSLSTPYDVASETIIQLNTRFNKLSEEERQLGFFSRFESIKFNEVSFKEVQHEAKTYLTSTGRTGIILLDSFEEVSVSRDEDALTISGLLRSVSRMHDPGEPLEIRCCIPAEAYFYITEISSNVLKDFQRQIVLHWSAMEILQVCSRRYSNFLEIHHPRVFLEHFSAFDLESRDGTRSFWMRVLPEKTQNLKKDIREDTIPYLMRHTQLLPRQMILLLNRCLSAHFSAGHTPEQRVSSELVSHVVRRTEGQIAQQIVTAHKFIWPDADKQISPILKELGHNVIRVGDLKRIFSRSPVRGYGNIYDFSDYLRMLTELGVIGRFIDRTDRFVVAMYEYSEPFRLLFNEDDLLCIHPCFTEAYRVLDRSNLPDDYLPVYPYGANPSDRDRREFG
ncbi:MAG: hypothetical protein ROR55_21205 [Devosia sp.]